MALLLTQRNQNGPNVGFTLIELLVVIAILVVLGTIVVSGFKNFQTQQTLELTVKEVRQMLETARSETLASRNDVHYGVYIGESEVVRFEGDTYVVGASGNVEFVLDPRVRISSISLSPATDEVVFSRGMGEPSSSGNIEVSLVTDPDSKRTISITSTGIINSNE